MQFDAAGGEDPVRVTGYGRGTDAGWCRLDGAAGKIDRNHVARIHPPQDIIECQHPSPAEIGQSFADNGGSVFYIAPDVVFELRVCNQCGERDGLRPVQRSGQGQSSY